LKAGVWCWIGVRVVLISLSPCLEVYAIYAWKLVGRVVGKSSEERVLVECWSKVLVSGSIKGVKLGGRD